MRAAVRDRISAVPDLPGQAEESAGAGVFERPESGRQDRLTESYFGSCHRSIHCRPASFFLYLSSLVPSFLAKSSLIASD